MLNSGGYAHGSEMVKAKLERRRYLNPPISTVVCQVVLDWQKEQLTAFTDTVRGKAQADYGRLYPLPEMLPSDPAIGERGAHDQPVELGFLAVSSDRKLNVFVEPQGLRVVSHGPYVGREPFFNAISWWVGELERCFGDLVALRVSVLVENHISVKPPDCRVSDLIETSFRLNDDRLSHFKAFVHDVWVDLSDLVDGPYRARLVAASKCDPNPEIVLAVDVLHDAASPLGDVVGRLQQVKDIETHVFEACIKDKARELWQPLS